MGNSKTSVIGTIIAIIILIVLVIVTNIGTNNITVMQKGISAVVIPIQNAFIFVKNKISSNEQEISEIGSLKEENKNLREENTKLKEGERELEVLKSENNTLKDYLNLKNKYADYNTVPGYVVERTYSNYDKIVVINVGLKDGINVNMPVISESGLVGHVISVSDNSAKVQTIVDTGSTVSATISTAQESILIKGTINNNEQIKATSIPANATILQGDAVVTSGLGGIYPKGILIGTIKDIVNTKNQTDRYANVETATNFNTLQSVLVITAK